MRLLYKILLVLVVAFLLPVAVLGITGYLAIRRVGERANESVRTELIRSEHERVLEYVRLKAAEIEGFCARYEGEVLHLRRGFMRIRTNPERYNLAQLKDVYPERNSGGLPGFGYVHPKFGAFNDFDDRIAGCPWLPRPAVKKAQTDPQFGDEAGRTLREVVLLDPYLVAAWDELKGTLDLAWVVLVTGATNVHPEYRYYDVLREEPQVLDLDESGEDYVRLLNPSNNPERKLRWLEPYLDQFKGIWMTSAVAPLYEGDRFLGTVGLDILLDVLVRKVISADPGSRGYAFLLTGSGRPLAVPEAGIADFVFDEGQARAVRETGLPGDRQSWDEKKIAALSGVSLDAHPDPAIRDIVRSMVRGEEAVADIVLGGKRRIVAYSPVKSAGWSLGVVVPEEEVLARGVEVEKVLDEGTERTARDYALLGACVVLICILVGLLLNYVAARPLVSLTRRVERLNWSNLDFPVPTDIRRDEIGQLTRGFAAAVGLIRESRDEATRKGAELQESNRQLSDANQSLHREVSERLATQVALSEEKELLAVTLGSIGDGVIATDRSGRVVLINPVAEKLVGMRRRDAEGHRLDEVFRIVDENTRLPLASPVERVLAEGIAVELANHTLLLAHDGVERAIADSGAPIRNARGEVIGVVLVFRDVTERRRFEEEMVRAQKLESVRLLAAGIAHDFNNLLAGILGNLSLAQARFLIDPEQVRERLAEAEKATVRARDLTLQLLTFSTGGAPIREAMSLPLVLEETAGFALRGSSVRCEVDVPEDLWPVLADEGQVAQVVHNLVLNARQAMPRGGVVRVWARNCSFGEDDRAVQLKPGRYVCVEVIDSGEGIAKEIQQRIFDPFYTTRPGGTGLGLAVCFSILARHEGRIEVDSEPGKGSTFRFWLPAADGEAPPATGREEVVTGGTGSILLMDDEEMIRDMGREILETLGYSVHVVCDGSEAIARFAEALASGNRFDLVILDLTVPGNLGGVETLRQLRRLAPDIPAIVSSGYSTDPVMSQHRKHGFDASIPKPYDIKLMARIVAGVLSKDLQRQ
ncbi:MAG: response regulator [Deltaproteobacteria bacterium]|nr:response regulator [Deltaproteobacteria bacterium]